MNRDFLSVNSLYKSFGRTVVLSGLDLRAARGEVIGILGRNGAGKTTLLRLILGLLQADSGTIALDGKVPDAGGAIRRHIGYVPEKPAFHSQMTAEDVFRFRSAFYGNWDMEKALSTAKRLELPLDKKSGVFSKGNLAKLAWCCAIAHDPQLLLLDEPTSGLDYLIKDKILDGLIGELVTAKKTVIIARHVMEDSFNLIDRLAVLSAGKIKEIHEAETLKAGAFLVTARLKESAAMPDPAAILSSEGRIVSIGVIGRENLGKVLAESCFESAEHRPMTPAEIFRALLCRTKEEL